MTEAQKELAQLQKRLLTVKMAVQEKYGKHFMPPEFNRITGPKVIKSLLGLIIPPAAYIFARIYFHYENERFATFRDKSVLFGRELKPGEKPSW